MITGTGREPTPRVPDCGDPGDSRHPGRIFTPQLSRSARNHRHRAETASAGPRRPRPGRLSTPRADLHAPTVEKRPQSRAAGGAPPPVPDSPDPGSSRHPGRTFAPQLSGSARNHRHRARTASSGRPPPRSGRSPTPRADVHAPTVGKRPVITGTGREPTPRVPGCGDPGDCRPPGRIYTPQLSGSARHRVVRLRRPREADQAVARRSRVRCQTAIARWSTRVV